MKYTRFLKMPEVIGRTAKGRSTIWAEINAGTFPPPIKLGPRSIGWIESEIEDYNQACIEASRPDVQDQVDGAEDEVSE